MGSERGQATVARVAVVRLLVLSCARAWGLVGAGGPGGRAGGAGGGAWCGAGLVACADGRVGVGLRCPGGAAATVASGRRGAAAGGARHRGGGERAVSSVGSRLARAAAWLVEPPAAGESPT